MCLGGDQAKFDAFIQLAKSNPAQAIRELVLTESLVKEELGKGKASASVPPRDEKTGKFQASSESKESAPAPKKITGAPGPTAEVGGKATAPADEIAEAVESGNQELFNAARNKRDLESRRKR
jgi:hypothetical protein